MKKQLKKGFTLTELVIVIVIIAILAAVLIPSMTGYVNRAKKSNAQSEASSVYTIYSAWLADIEDNGGYEGVDLVTVNTSATSDTYAKTNDTSVVAGKTYFTYADNSYTSVAEPDENKLSYYYELTVAKVKATADTENTNRLTASFKAYYLVAQDSKTSKITFVSVSATEFTIISSNNFYAKCSIANGSPEYTIGEKAGLEL